jgi:hypothetical protein
VESGHPNGAEINPSAKRERFSPAPRTAVEAAQANYDAAFVLAITDGNNIEAAFAAATERCARCGRQGKISRSRARLRLQLTFDFVEPSRPDCRRHLIQIVAKQPRRSRAEIRART